MAIIAAIAIPSFSAIRDNAATKADEQSLETAKRTALMLAADGTITEGTFTITPGKPATAVKDPVNATESGKLANSITLESLKVSTHTGIQIEVGADGKLVDAGCKLLP